MNCLSAKEIVNKLDRYIIGQDEAKKAVGIALRNRYRRSKLDDEIRNEITPKNIIMAGPTGVGKTEIARRLAKLTGSPFVKVEATKFTEVGYVGRDVDSIVRDLVEASIRMVKEEMLESVKMQAQTNAHERLIDLLLPQKPKPKQDKNDFQSALSMLIPSQEKAEELTEEEKSQRLTARQQIAKQLNDGSLEDNMVEIEVDAPQVMALDVMGGMGAEINLGDMFSGMMPKKTKNRKVKVSDARGILEQEEASKLIDMDDVTSEAVKRAEQQGIVFLDEIDKIAGKGGGSGPDVSREGVQRDILPLVEGSTVMTKYGPVKTDFVLFIAAGAFHVAKFSDLIPELQGRFPIKVNLKSLTKEDMVMILSKTDNAIIKQYQSLLSVDNIDLKFTDDALDAIGDYAIAANEENENIGARRLHTIIENLLEDVSFNATGDHPMMDVVIDEKYVSSHLTDDYKKQNLKNSIL